MLNNLDHTNRIHRTKCKLTNNNTANANADDTKVSTFPNESQTRWLCQTNVLLEFRTLRFGDW